MAMIRLSGLDLTLVGSAMLLAFMGCDSGGTTTGPGQGGNNAGVGGDTSVGVHTGGSVTVGVGGSGNTGNPGQGGSGNTGNTPSCGSVLPTATGSLSVTSGYVTVGTLKGYGFAWKGDKSNASTCVIPTCGSTGCTPAFGTSALCATGVVAADTTFNSIAGVGFNFNQSQAGGTGSEMTVSAPANVVVDAQLGSGTGDSNARIQIVSGVGATAKNYCVKEGTWSSGTPIPITSFNTSCWDTTLAGAEPLAAGAAITSIDIVIPSADVSDRPFAVCLKNVQFQ